MGEALALPTRKHTIRTFNVTYTKGVSAFAVVYNCDIIISWNFKHLVNYKTINKVKIVNAINHYKEISIMPPSMLLEEVEQNDWKYGNVGNP
jgi:hypothetical protein